MMGAVRNVLSPVVSSAVGRTEPDLGYQSPFTKTRAPALTLPVMSATRHGSMEQTGADDWFRNTPESRDPTPRVSPRGLERDMAEQGGREM